MEVRIIPASYKIDFLFFTVALFTVLHFQTKDRSRYETIQHKDNNGIGTGTEEQRPRDKNTLIKALIPCLFAL